MDTTDDAKKFSELTSSLRTQIGRIIVGNEEIIDGIITALFCGGHCLLEGAPGLGKTLLVRTLANILDLNFSRIQFTPDLMPADITGTNVIEISPSGSREMLLRKGPVFTQVLLADEINRATPKTQSALLEAMQEQSVTISGTTHRLCEPFFVLATQNPIDMEGTYQLPEAQLDRFMFKLTVCAPTTDNLVDIVNRETTQNHATTEKTASAHDITNWRNKIREVITAQEVIYYAANIISALTPKSHNCSKPCTQFIRFGPSPRAVIALVMAAKTHALANGRYNCCFEDIRKFTLPVLRHRLILNFEGEAENISTDEIINQTLKTIPE